MTALPKTPAGRIKLAEKINAQRSELAMITCHLVAALYADGLGTRTIGELLGISDGTVRSRLRAAEIALRPQGRRPKNPAV